MSDDFGEFELDDSVLDEAAKRNEDKLAAQDAEAAAVVADNDCGDACKI